MLRIYPFIPNLIGRDLLCWPEGTEADRKGKPVKATPPPALGDTPAHLCPVISDNSKKYMNAKGL